MKRKLLLSAWCALALVPMMPRAEASTLGVSSAASASVLYSDSELVQGSQASVATLSIPSAGELFLTLTDLKFPDDFSSLKFALTDTSTALVGLADPGTLTLNLTGPTTLYAEVFANAQGAADIGLYNLTATFLGNSSPVPLPPSGLLLAGVSLLALLLNRLLQRRALTTVTTAVA
jgi:hypothetical protein